MDWKSRRVQAILEQALTEDKVTSDETTRVTIAPDLPAAATILAKQDCILSGLGAIVPILNIFVKLDGRSSGRFEVISHPEMFEGVRVRDGQAIAVIRHNARTILACERVILNLMQRMSGIATLTRQYVDAVAGTNVKILDTRKTVPGLRLMDKYAVRCGGGQNHRLDLSDGILIKNNHISLGGGIPKVLARALELRKPGQTVQVEVRTQQELQEALDGGAEAILLDNMSPGDVKKSVERIRGANESIPVEASGGMTLETVGKYARTGVDYISVGALTHSAVAVDLSMRMTAEIY